MSIPPSPFCPQILPAGPGWDCLRLGAGSDLHLVGVVTGGSAGRAIEWDTLWLAVAASPGTSSFRLRQAPVLSTGARWLLDWREVRRNSTKYVSETRQVGTRQVKDKDGKIKNELVYEYGRIARRW